MKKLDECSADREGCGRGGGGRRFIECVMKSLTLYDLGRGGCMLGTISFGYS